MAKARESESQALAAKLQYEEKLSASKEEAAAIVTEARDNAKVQYDKIVKDANAQADRIIATAHETASADQERAMKQAQNQIAGMVVAAAAKVIQGEISEGGNRSVYDEFIAEAGGCYDAGGN